jgi:hypothetical protein
MGMMEQTDNLLRQLSETLEQFKKDSGKEPTLVVVSAEIFAKIMPALENVKHDKNYSEGKLGSVTVKSDFLVQDDNIIVTRPPEWNDKFPLYEFLPAIPPFETLYQKKRKALKEKMKDFLKRSKRNEI